MSAVLAWQPVSATVAEDVRVDAVALEEGVRTRLGPAAQGWTVVVESTGPQAPRSLRVRLRGPNERAVGLTVEVLGSDPEARAVELAAAVALAIEDADEDAAPTPASRAEADVDTHGRGEARPASSASGPAGWIGARAHVETNTRADASVDGGAALRGGMWLARDHLQPTLGLQWGHSRRGELRVHALSAEACGLAGGWVGRRAWLGAGGCVAARRALALDRDRAVRWGAVVGLPARVQVWVHSRVLLMADVGLRVSPTPLRFLGVESVLRWRRLRLMGGLGVAVTLGDPRPLARRRRRSTG